MSQQANKKAEVILTGDRPTGKLHLGHFIGSLANRISLQEIYKQFIMIADIQALTDNFDNPDKVRSNILEVICDYLAVGIDPTKSTIFIQSQIPQIAELTVLYMNLVTLSRLQRNPTVKTEMAQKGYNESVPVGFLAYPISQAADITIVKATLVPVGEDQLPVIEQTNEIVRSFNRTYNCEIFPEAKALVPKFARLPGTDGKSKMSKSLSNAIFLSDSQEEIIRKVKSMYTDCNHLKVSDPGQIEGNTVFTYLDLFDSNKKEVEALKEHYQRGGLGDTVLKHRLIDVLENFLSPIRAKRKELEKDPKYLMQILHNGTKEVQEIAKATMQEVFKCIKLDYF